MENAKLEELLEKARAAKSPEELLSLAKENDYPLSEEEANAYFERISKSGDLSDKELENVAGGGCNDDYMLVTEVYCCGHFICVDCGNKERSCTCSGGTLGHRHCGKCKYVRYKNCQWMCTHPENNK